MIAQHLKRIGIQADVKEMERNLALSRRTANEAQIGVDVHWGTENMFSHPMVSLFAFDPTSQLGPTYGVVVRHRRRAGEGASGQDQGGDAAVPGCLQRP